MKHPKYPKDRKKRNMLGPLLQRKHDKHNLEVVAHIHILKCKHYSIVIFLLNKQRIWLIFNIKLEGYLALCQTYRMEVFYDYSIKHKLHFT